MTKFANYISTRVRFDQRLNELTFPEVTLNMVMTAVLSALCKDEQPKHQVQVPVIATRIADRLIGGQYAWFYDPEYDTRYFISSVRIDGKLELIAMYNAFPFENGMYCVMASGPQAALKMGIDGPIVSDITIIDKVFGFEPLTDDEEFVNIERALIHLSHTEPGQFWPWYVVEQDQEAKKKAAQAAEDQRVAVAVPTIPVSIPQALATEQQTETAPEPVSTPAAPIAEPAIPPVAPEQTERTTPQNQMERAFEDARSAVAATK